MSITLQIGTDLTTFGYRKRFSISVYNVHTLFENSIEGSQNVRFSHLKQDFQRYKLNILELSDVKCWTSGEYSPFSSGTHSAVLLYYILESLMIANNDPVLLMITTAMHRLLTWEAVSDRKLIATFRC